MADLRKFSASLFAPAFHPSPLCLPPFGPSDSNSNLNGEDSEAETEKDWFDESQCYDPRTCRAPIFYFPRALFPYSPISAPFLLIPTDLYLFKALTR